MKKIALLSILLATLGASQVYATAYPTGTITATGTVPAFYEITPIGATNATLTMSGLSSGVLSSTTLPSGTTITAKSNSDAWKITVAVTGAGSSDTSTANVLSLNAATPTTGGFTNAITVTDVLIGTQSIFSGYNETTNNEALNLSGVLKVIGNSSSAPLLAGDYKGNVVITLTDSDV
jgi:hypothetical protein